MGRRRARECAAWGRTSLESADIGGAATIRRREMGRDRDGLVGVASDL